MGRVVQNRRSDGQRQAARAFYRLRHSFDTTNSIAGAWGPATYAKDDYSEAVISSPFAVRLKFGEPAAVSRGFDECGPILFIQAEDGALIPVPLGDSVQAGDVVRAENTGSGLNVFCNDKALGRVVGGKFEPEQEK